jgi:pilus assembly protein CpaF
VTDVDLVRRVRGRLAVPASAVDLDEAVRAEAHGIVDDADCASRGGEGRAELDGAGPLEPLLALDGVTDVLVNGPDSVWLDRGGGLERVAVRFADDAAVRRLAQRMASAAGRRLDDAAPFVDAALADGTRLHAVVPPLAPYTTMSLRVLARQPLSVPDLVSRGALTDELAALLHAVMRARLPFVITGGTGAGKTTLLGAVLALADERERLLLLEDVPELVVERPHVVRLRTRAANVEGAGEVGLRELVRQALRMRPDRLVVGEFRGPEMVELLVALNTGHDGGAATMHANSAADVPSRFVALGALAGLDGAAVSALVVSALDLVVHLRRGRDGVRRIDEIALLRAAGTGLSVSPVWRAGELGPAAASLAGRLADRGAPVPEVLSRC